MSNGAASNGGKGVFTWPGRQLLGSAELSTKELLRIAKDPRTRKHAQMVARSIGYGRIRRRHTKRILKAQQGLALPERSL